ncbi:MAG: 3-oxoacyl-[acyl-carrier-protein] reductase [Lachnospiraceae bacterium]|nr:3-oxoacyl-[acyl-carrier-protein] reductase [Lachnospiraceae bacterium]
MMENRVALVTGGSRGIGKSICLELAKAGYDIVTCYTSKSAEAEETVAACKTFGVNAVAYQANVANEADVTELFAQLKAQFGRIDVLVNNAGITKDDLLLRMSEEVFMQVIDVNLKGAFLCCKAASKMMLKNKYGRIINISSVVGLGGNAGQANYAASKAGLIGLTKTIAKELGGKGITANAVAPGFIQTDMTDQLSEEAQNFWEERIPRKRLGKPEDVAAAVRFLASEEADYISGQVLAVDGGMSC